MPQQTNKKTIIKAAPVAALMILLMLSPGCSSRSGSPPLSAFRLIADYPVSTMNNGSVQILTLRDTIGMVFSGGYTLYYLVPRTSFETNKKIPGTETYFFYGDSRRKGILFHSLADSSSQLRLNVDSFLGARAFKTFHVNRAPGILVDSLYSGDGTNLFEAYVPAQRKGANSVDSIYLYFSANLNAVPYSFSPELDSLKKKKLYKVRLLFNADKPPDQDIVVPKRELSLELQPWPITDSATVKNVVDRWSKLIK